MGRRLISVLGVPFTSGTSNIEYKITGSIASEGKVSSIVKIGYRFSGSVAGEGLVYSNINNSIINNIKG